MCHTKTPSRKVDPRIKESHMKERGLSIRKSSNVVVEKDTDQINTLDNFMDIDIGGFDNDGSNSKQELYGFNFLVTTPKKS
ncbi:2247_t:CDS:2 [Funneliformis caledonium]|uniref:2247_t:CDS:1 n=1 Tax=Funneliformis caledonium TaxID=1117310 RepID=A0A9N9GIH7_9GLOM|nr:2247_t:CDS:2 [Funneliformis caledonium]